MTTRRKRRPGRWVQSHGLGIGAALGLVVLFGAYLGVLEYSRPHVDGDRLRFDSFVSLVREGRVRSAHLLDEDAYVVGNYLRGPASTTGPADDDAAHDHGVDLNVPPAPPPTPGTDRVARYNAPLVRGTQGEILELLLRNGVPITVDQQVGKRVASLATLLLPALIIVVLFIYLILSYRRGTGLFGIRSGARRIDEGEAGATFADVAGQDAAVAELGEVARFLSDPDRFAALGASVPRGILLYGPPGCGKTLLARALAGEAGVSFYSISGSDFVELYVGVGAARVRDLFRQARENAPAVVFIDELDSVGRARAAAGAAMAHGEQEQALNQLLAEMDGIARATPVIVLAATNRPDVLDPALLRPGRFDRSIGLERPSEEDRLAILRVHATDKVLGPDVDLATVAQHAVGLTGADLASVLNEAALLAVRRGEPAIAQSDVEEALRRILDAPERQRRLSMRERSVGTRATAGEQRATFARVAGVDEAVAELAELRDYLSDPDRFARMGARVPAGIILTGPPGCGKTLLARAVAGEANAAFFSVAASQFVEVFVGQGAARVRDLFAEARSVAPSIVFIDEIDAIAARRGASADGNREADQTLNQILVELDGFEPRTGVLVMAATNRPDILDPALVRPGRFDRQVTVNLPDRSGRRAILALHAEARPLGTDVDLDVIAGLTQGFSGADLANVLNEAALLAIRRGLDAVPMILVEEAVDRRILGVASRGTVLSEQERRLVAYHEAGHALVTLALPGATPPRKLTIVPKAGALAHCSLLDTHDRVVRSHSMLANELAALLGGRAAEDLVFGDRASLAADDLARVRELAAWMVRELGMSDVLGPLAYDAKADPSPEEARIVYLEVRAIVDDAYRRASDVLVGARHVLDRVAQALLDRETLSSDELTQLTAELFVPVPQPHRAS